MEDKHSSDASSLLPQNILSQTSRHNDRDYRLPRAETHSSSTPVQHPIKPVVHPTATPSTVPSSPFTLQSDHQPKKSFDANGASTLSKLPTPTSSVPAQKTERKGMPLLLDAARWNNSFWLYYIIFVTLNKTLNYKFYKSSRMLLHRFKSRASHIFSNF